MVLIFLISVCLILGSQIWLYFLEILLVKFPYKFLSSNQNEVLFYLINSVIFLNSFGWRHQWSTRLQCADYASFLFADLEVSSTKMTRVKATQSRKKTVVKKVMMTMMRLASMNGFWIWLVRRVKVVWEGSEFEQQSRTVEMMSMMGTEQMRMSLSQKKVMQGWETLLSRKLVRRATKETIRRTMLPYLLLMSQGDVKAQRLSTARTQIGVSFWKTKASLRDIMSNLKTMCLQGLSSQSRSYQSYSTSYWFSSCRSLKLPKMVWKISSVSRLTSCAGFLLSMKLTRQLMSVCGCIFCLTLYLLCSVMACVEKLMILNPANYGKQMYGENWLMLGSVLLRRSMALYLMLYCRQTCERMTRWLTTSICRQGKSMRSKLAAHQRLPFILQVMQSSLLQAERTSLMMYWGLSRIMTSGMQMIWLYPNQRTRWLRMYYLSSGMLTLRLIVMWMTKRAVTVRRSQSMPMIYSTWARGQTGTKKVLGYFLQLKMLFQMLMSSAQSFQFYFIYIISDCYLFQDLIRFIELRRVVSFG